jgi:hypothetical protein
MRDALELEHAEGDSLRTWHYRVVLNEQKATGILYDAVTDVARVFVVEPPGTVRTRTIDGTLLLDREGHLVGVDVGPEEPGRIVVMLGAHEAVARTLGTRLSVSTDASSMVYEVRIPAAKAAIRATDRNPYVPSPR